MKQRFLIVVLFVCLIFAMVACTDGELPSGATSGSISGTETSGTVDPVLPEPSGSVIPTPSEPSGSVKPSDPSGTVDPSDPSGTVNPSEPSGGEEEDPLPPPPVKYPIRLYRTEAVDDYTVLEYEEGETVSISEWPVPQGILFEGDTIPFSCWLDEQQENEISEDFLMPAQSMAFYASYDYPQLFRWSYDSQSQTYTSTGAGIRPAKNIEGGYSGTLSAELTVNNSSSAAIGIIWNLTCSNNDYPYAEGCSYWYFHLNPANGKFQLAYVQEDGSYTAPKTLSLDEAPQAWQDKYAEYKNSDDGVLTAVFSVEFGTSEIVLKIDGEELYKYTGNMLGKITGKGVGVRTNVAGNAAKNITYTPDSAASSTYVVTYVNTQSDTEESILVSADNFTLPSPSVSGYEFLGWYEDEEFTSEKITSDFALCADATFYGKFAAIQSKNGFNIYSDGRYESTAAKVAVTVAGTGSKYGKWSVDITETDRSNARVGILINSYVKSADGAVLYTDASVSGYYVHHSIQANANFTLTTIYQGVYQQHPDGTKGNLNVCSYKSTSTGALGAYYAKCKDFLDGKTSSLSFNLAVEVMPEYIKVYLDGECIINYTTAAGLGLFDSVNGCVGVGFNTAKVGTVFSNMSFVPYIPES